MKAYKDIQKDLGALAAKGERTQAFVDKHFGDAGKSAVRDVKEGASLAEVTKALKASNQFADFRDLARQVENQRLRTKALVEAMENTATGFYLQAKLETLLSSKELCEAVQGCSGEGKRGSGPKLDGLFDRKTHDGKK